MISKRLSTIAEMIKPYKRIADVGCDHGYLIKEAFENSNIEYAIAIDNKIGPLNSAKKNIEKHNFNVRFSLSDGISDISDVEVVVISGMGGLLITKILSNTDKLIGVKRLILQANRNNYELRCFLMKNQWKIIDEKIVYDEAIYYEIIVCEKSNEKVLYNDDELNYGPILLKNKDSLFIDKLKSEINHLKSLNTNSLEVTKKIERLEKICL